MNDTYEFIASAVVSHKVFVAVSFQLIVTFFVKLKAHLMFPALR